MDAAEVRRRLWHMAPGLLVLLLPWMGDSFSLLDLAIAGTLATVATLIAIRSYRTIARPGERSWMSGFVGYPVLVLLTLVLFPNDLEYAAVVLAVLAFGDGSATLAGLLIGGPRLPWNRAKSWAGSVGFVACAAPASAIAYWWVAGGAAGVLGWHPGSAGAAPAVAFGATAALCGAAAESLPLRVNDNLRVGAAAVLAVAVMSALLYS